MEWDEWRDAYRDTMKALVGCTDAQAMGSAEAARDIYDDDPGEDPGEAVHEEVSCWDDDGE